MSPNLAGSVYTARETERQTDNTTTEEETLARSFLHVGGHILWITLPGLGFAARGVRTEVLGGRFVGIDIFHVDEHDIGFDQTTRGVVQKKEN